MFYHCHLGRHHLQKFRYNIRSCAARIQLIINVFFIVKTQFKNKYLEFLFLL